VAENMHQVLWVKEARSRQYEYINEAFEKIFGRSRSTLDGDPESWKSSVVLSDRLLVEDMLRAQANGEPTEAHYRIRDESGGIRWLWDRSFPVYDMNGTQTQVIGLSEDITAFKQTEAALLDSQEKLEERVRERTAQLAEQAELVKILIDSAPVAMYVIDREGNITHCSRATTEMMGYASSDEVMGKNAHTLMHHSHGDGTPYPLTACPIYACFQSGADQRVEGEVFWRKDGAPVPVEYHARQIHRADKVVGVIISIFSVTERREQEIELRHSQKLEAVGRLAAGIAHEINTPIQFVGDNNRFLKDSFYDELRLIQKYEELARAAASGPVPKALLDEVESQRQSTDWDYLQVEIPKAIEQMFEGLTRVSTIVRGMKEFSHVDRSSEKGPADINRALESTLIVARNELKYVADLETHFGELPTVICNLGDVNQVFLNLLINAAHAITDAVKGTNARGKIVVSTRLDGDSVEVSISDSGTGVPEEVRTKIFDPFFTTKEVGKGTGQGLALARAVIVDKHGGTITFDTKMGAGTTFFVRLPLVPANLREEVASR
jgi:two-component system, NtrC family, sensor kinase